MNPPSPVPTPAKAAVAPVVAPTVPIAPIAPAIVSPKAKIARGVEKQHNREVGHMLKAASLHRPTITRSLPHSRGR